MKALNAPAAPGHGRIALAGGSKPWGHRVEASDER